MSFRGGKTFPSISIDKLKRTHQWVDHFRFPGKCRVSGLRQVERSQSMSVNTWKWKNIVKCYHIINISSFSKVRLIPFLIIRYMFWEPKSIWGRISSRIAIAKPHFRTLGAACRRRAPISNWNVRLPSVTIFNLLCPSRARNGLPNHNKGSIESVNDHRWLCLYFDSNKYGVLLPKRGLS